MPPITLQTTRTTNPNGTPQKNISGKKTMDPHADTRYLIKEEIAKCKYPLKSKKLKTVQQENETCYQ